MQVAIFPAHHFAKKVISLTRTTFLPVRSDQIQRKFLKIWSLNLKLICIHNEMKEFNLPEIDI